MNNKNSIEFKYKAKIYKRGNKENSLKKLALEIIKDYSTNMSIEEVLNKLNVICSTAKGLPLLIKKSELEENEDLKSWYFESEKECIKIKNEIYFLYAWWNITEIRKLIEITGVKVNQ